MPNWLIVLLAAVIPSGIGLAGVWLGSWMNQRGAEKLSERTLEGQRTLANDAARREWRRQQVAPYLEAANERVRLWNGVYLMTLSETRDKPVDQLSKDEVETALDESKRALSLNQQILDPDFLSLRLTRHAIPDEAFKAALKLIIDADAQLKLGSTTQEVNDMLAKIGPAIAALNQAAERYIFSPADDGAGLVPRIRG
jgi:hypothetical protein